MLSEHVVKHWDEDGRVASSKNSQGWSILDATAQAALVARGEATPADLVAAACERVERLDPDLGAVPVFYGAEALEAVRSVRDDAQFPGVPFLMKDVGARQVGQPYYAGNRALRDADHRADSDTLLGARFRELGLVTIGNSNSPEFGLQSNTWPIAHGPTHNPWNLAHSAGGSSGGACAAVAAGLVPVAHASDGAGSIRIPASWCGLIGLKPTRDRVHWRYSGQDRADVEFVVARSLRDTAALLDLLRPPTVRREKPGRHVSALGQTPPRLQIGICTQSPAGGPVHPACVRAVEETAEALRASGHLVRQAAPSTFGDYEERSLHGAAFGVREYLECLEDLELRLGREIGPDDVEPFLWEIAHSEAGELSPAESEKATTWLSEWRQRTLGWFNEFDLLVTPTVCEPAPRLDSLDPSNHAPIDLLGKMVPHMAFTEIWNATGQPAISLPIGFSEEESLPVGVQLVAAPGRDALLLSISAQLLPSLDAVPRQAPIHA
jgi:amidase